VARAQELARAQKRTVWDVFCQAGEQPRGESGVQGEATPPQKDLAHAAERIAQFVAVLRKYGEKLAQRGFSEAARALVEEVGLFEEARRGAQSLPAQARRIEAIESLLRQLIDYEKRQEQRAAERAVAAPQEPGPEPGARSLEPAEAEGLEPGARSPEPEEEDDVFAAGLPGYLARLALDSKEADGDAGDCVTLMTLHGAKGLEWRCVFLAGMEEGLLPHSGRGFDDGPDKAEGTINLEEERRLCYVGLTRARERLILTRATERVRRGKPLPRTPSRFLDDIPAELVDVIDLAGPQAESKKEVQQQKAKNFFAAMGNLLGDDPV
jgi:ATP-dependent DNA helicase UvrD/PcrA